MANSTAMLQPSEPEDFPLHPSLNLEELRQTSPSRLAYHRTYSLRGGKLPLSKEIGLLLWLNDHFLLTPWGGERRLLLLQRKASFEALQSAIEFRRLLNTNVKRQMDFFHHAVYLNRPLSDGYLRRKELRRIGIGYRDKGTLPEPSGRARLDAEKAYWFRVEDIGFELADGFPIEGEWVDLSSICYQIFPLP